MFDEDRSRESYNLAAVHLLEQVGIQAGAQMVRRFGISNPMAPSCRQLGCIGSIASRNDAAYARFLIREFEFSRT